ncbi:MAG: HEPN domain-containing protein [Thermofilaceae archaeon]
MSIEEVEIPRRRALTFLNHAREAVERGEFDFARLSSEQAAQLSVMLELAGETPRPHRARELLHLPSRLAPEAEEPVTEFIRRNREAPRALDDAYIASRYLPSAYTREEALVKLAESLIELVSEVLERCKR